MPYDRTKDLLSVAIAIPTYNRESVLVETIQQVLTQDPPADEVLVIDQTARHEPETEAFLKEADSAGRLRWIHQSHPNLNKARNKALAETNCEIVLFIDDDVRLCKGFIENHRRNYADPSVLGVAGRTIQASGNIPVDRAAPWLKPLRCPIFALDYTTRLEGVACFIGANHSVRVAPVLRLGGYDENFIAPMYDEADLALRMWKAGMRIVFDPDAEVFHLQTTDGGVREKPGDHYPEWWQSYSGIYFHWKHFYPGWYFWKMICFLHFRRSALRKTNVFNPSRLPWAIISYGYSVLKARKLLRQKKA